MDLEFMQVSVGVVAAIMILREVFNFLYKLKSKETEGSILIKLDLVLDKLTATSEKVAVIEAIINEQKANVERFWSKDWPEIMTKIKDLEEEVDFLKETVIKLKAVHVGKFGVA